MEQTRKQKKKKQMQIFIDEKAFRKIKITKKHFSIR